MTPSEYPDNSLAVVIVIQVVSSEYDCGVTSVVTQDVT